MIKTVFEVPKMDCPSEERAIRLAFEGMNEVKKLTFDLAKRKLEVMHENPSDSVLAILSPLGFGAKIQSSSTITDNVQVEPPSATQNAAETSVLQKVFALNAIMFLVEIIAGFFAQSTGLIADSLDMFADAAVFALSLYAVGKARQLKVRAARLSGYFQMVLALGALAEVVRRAVFGSEPEAYSMMIISAIALAANLASMWIFQKHRNGEVHMKASWIFLTNDVIANAGVILAGALVLFTKSYVPDLVVGAIIALIVLSGAIRILKSTKA